MSISLVCNFLLEIIVCEFDVVSYLIFTNVLKETV